MSVIDQNLDLTNEGVATERGLNINKLVSYLLFVFGYYFLERVNGRFEADSTFDYHTLFCLESLAAIVGGLLMLLPVRPKLISITGIGLILFITFLNFFTDLTGALPSLLLIHLGHGMVIYSLLTQLLQNTAYFKRPQKIIFIAVSSIGFVRYVFMAFIMRAGLDRTNGMLAVGAIILITSLIFVAIDTETEPVKRSWSSFKPDFPALLKTFILPLAGFALLIYWCTMQTNHYFNLYTALNNQSKYTIAIFLLEATSIGILALIIFPSYKVDHKLLLYISGGLILLLTFVCFAYPLSSGNNSAWILATLNYLAEGLVTSSFIIWLYRYADFTYFTLLLMITSVAADLAYVLNIYIHLPEKYSYFNF